MQEAELRLDLEELRLLESTANRLTVKNVITQEIKRIEQSLSIIEKATKAKSASVSTSPTTAEGAKDAKVGASAVSISKIYEAPKSYSFDQTNEVYIMLEGIKASGAEVLSQFSKRSFDVKIHGYKNPDIRLNIQELCEEINPDTSKVIVNNNNVTVKLEKAKKGTNWGQLIKKEDKFKAEDVPKDSAKDPQAGLMDMMKKLYEDGDENMKRTIAEAWTKGMDGKKSGKDL